MNGSSRPIPVARGFALLVAALAGIALAAGCRGKESPSPGSGALSSVAEAAVAAAVRPYEAIRESLASDRLDGLDAAGRELAASLSPEARAEPPETNLLAEASRAASALAGAGTLEEARASFADLSRSFLALAGRSASLRARLHLFECPMLSGYNRWAQTTTEVRNPYMGSRMLRCANALAWETVTAADPALGSPHAGHGGAPPAAADGEGEIAYYTCPMHTYIRSHEPGTCPVCSMTLVPVTREELSTGTVMIDAQRRQAIGVRTAPVERRVIEKTIRTVGRITYDETRLSDVSLKVGGWIGTLYADAPGKKVQAGAPLFTLYSPELYSAQEEYLTALRSQEAARGTSAPDRADYLVEAAATRLRLWDVTDAQLQEIQAGRAPLKYFPIVSPATGFIVEKNVVEGASLMPGERLFRIAALDEIWIEASLYESEFPLVFAGQPVRVTLPYLPDRRISGKVAFIYPYLDGEARTGRIRIVVENPDLDLRPDMYATVELDVDLGSRLVVPESAVIYAGPRQFVFLDLGEGRLRPQRVELGLKTSDFVEVTDGVSEGDPIVVSGNFLVAAESRLKTAMENW